MVVEGAPRVGFCQVVDGIPVPLLLLSYIPLGVLAGELPSLRISLRMVGRIQN